MELLLDIFQDQPDLWARYKAGKNGQKATFLKNFLSAELQRRFCPTMRKPETVAGHVRISFSFVELQLTGKITTHLGRLRTAQDEAGRTGLGLGGFMMVNGVKVVPRDDKEIDGE